MTGSSATPVRRATAVMASSSLRKLSCWPRVEAPRSKARVPIATFQPSPSPPTTLAASVRAPSKNTSLNSLSPVTWTMGRISMPSWRMGTSRYDSPSCLRRGSAGGDVRASTKHQSAQWASEVHTFWPWTVQWPVSSSSARVATLARSLPASGSE